MSRFYISDSHFGHANSLKFKRNDGSPLRDFKSVEEMDECMVERWNGAVHPNDTVYHLGDVVIHRRCLKILDRLNGRKILIRGNHDIFHLKDYVKYFKDVRAYDVKHGRILSHIPIHEASLGRYGLNFHGHLHANSLDDPRYVSMCVEQLDYTPIEHDAIMQRVKDNPGESVDKLKNIHIDECPVDGATC